MMAENVEEHNLASTTNRDQDHAEQRRLAGEYKPTYDGSLISPKLSTDLIHQEYQHGDVAFQVKTTNLPKDFSFFRKVRGDGNCGFRAFYFGLLEVLIELPTGQPLEDQKARFATVNGLLQRSGVDSIIWEDWVEATDRLLTTLIAAGTKQERLDLLFAAFNNEDDMSDEHSRELLTHLRFLISYHIKENQQQYQDFIQDGTIDTYCSTLETVSAEMDEISLTAAYNLLGAPAQVAVEVLYLDRSIGDSVTRHRWESGQASEHGTITMLFRPGHYDLAYPKIGSD